MQVFRQFANDRHLVRHVVVRDLFASTDAERRSDRLSKLQHKLARANVARGKTMTRRNRVANFEHRLVRQQQFQTRRRRLLDDGNVVFRIDDDREFT